MTFSEKIEIILKTNELGIATMEDLSEKAGFHKDTIRKAVERESALNKRNTRTFTDKIGINREWWETGKGEIFIAASGEKHTHDKIEPAVKENAGNPDLYKKVIEGGTEYLLVPRTAFEGSHRFTSVEQINAQTQELKDKQDTIVSLTNIIVDMLSGRIPKLTKIEEAKKDASV